MTKRLVVFHIIPIVLGSLLPKEDLLGNQFGVVIQYIVRKYFLDDKPVYNCRYQSDDKVHHEQKIFELLSKEFQLITYGCSKDDEEYTNQYNIRIGSAVIMLPEVAIATQIEVSVRLVLRAVITFGDVLKNIVIISSYESKSRMEQKEIALRLLDKLWQQTYQSEIIVLLPEFGWSVNSRNKHPPINVFGWFMEEQKVKCLSRIKKVSLFNRWISQEQGFQNESNLFPPKEVTNLHGCTYKVLYTEIEPYTYHKEPTVWGILPHIFHIIGNELNVQFVYGNFPKEEADIMFPVWIMDDTIQPDDCVLFSSYSTENIYWYVPVMQVPRWQAVIRVYNPLIWSLITMAFFLGSMTFWLISKFQYPDDTNLGLIFLNTLLAYTGGNSRYRLKGTFYFGFLILWLFYCLQIYTTYQSQLFGLFLYTGHYRPIQTEEELNISGLAKYTTISYDSRSHSLHYPYKNINIALSEIYEHQNCSLLASNNLVDLYIPIKYTEYGKPQIVKIEKPIMSFKIGFYYATKCIISKRMNDIIKQYYHYGMFDDLGRRVYREFLKAYKDTKNGDTVALLSTTQSVFYLLLAGLFFAFVVFLCEIFLHCRKFNLK